MKSIPFGVAARSAAMFLIVLCVSILMYGPSFAGSVDSGRGGLPSSSPCDSVSPSPFAEGMVVFTVSINGGGNTAGVVANDSFTVSMDYYLQVCPTTTQNFVQLVAGFATSSPDLCVFRGRVDCTGKSGNFTFRMRAPAFPSEHLIAFDLRRTTTEPACPTVWPNGTPVPDRYLGCITVTTGNLPYPVTGYADNVTGTSATLHGEVNPGGFPTTARFVFGTSPGVYTDSVTTFESPVTGTSLLAVSGGLTGLTPNTRYYYRATAENVHGYDVSSENTFFTGPEFALAEPEHSFGYLPPGGSKTDSIMVYNTGNTTLPITTVGALSVDFLVTPTSASLPAGDSMKFAVTYVPHAYGRSQSAIVFLHGASGSPDTQIVTGAVPIGGVLAGWNVISLPLTAPDPGRASLFPEAVSNAFGFNNMYFTADTLLNGKGYWLKFPAADSMVVSGDPRAVDTTTVTAGWNIIGVPSFPVPLDSVTTTPPGIIPGTFFEYAAGYSTVTMLRPGKGYWVKVTGGGTLRMSGVSGSSLPEVSPSIPHGAVALVVTDAGGNHRRLYVTGPSSSPAERVIEAPPPPPAGIFDVRFSGDLLGARPPGGAATRLALEFRDAAYPVVISWEDGIPEVTMAAGGRTVSLDLPGDVIVNEGEEVWFSRTGRHAGRPLVESYGIIRNYPNPFNPSTVMTFTLGEGGEVGLAVFNMLGERVFLLDGGITDAGRHEVLFDAAGLPAGVYVARLTAGRAVSSIKMLLVK